MKVDELIRAELRAVLEENQTISADAGEVIQQHQAAEEKWEANANKLIYENARKRTFSDPVEKQKLDELGKKIENARIAASMADRRYEEVMKFAKHVNRLEDYKQRMLKQEENEKLFKEHAKTQTMAEYKRNLRDYIRAIDKLVNSSVRFISNMTDIQAQADREKALIQARLDKAEGI
ncbi:MAG: hypothetical protein KME37_07710 [Candidatus Thiodiazotropha sp. (ex Codakia orbicularis)]|nr:hypothetical protein [Candidatus Thiodiazotropha sp. (ex Codakia orbicularis)]